MVSHMHVGDPEVRCVLRSFGCESHDLYKCAVIATSALGDVPLMGVLEHCDVVTRKPFAKLSSTSIQRLMSQAAVQESAANGGGK
eukprot:3279806-Pyramimonas_sp.AAC.1